MVAEMERQNKSWKLEGKQWTHRMWRKIWGDDGDKGVLNLNEGVSEGISEGKISEKKSGKESKKWHFVGPPQKLIIPRIIRNAVTEFIREEAVTAAPSVGGKLVLSQEVVAIIRKEFSIKVENLCVGILREHTVCTHRLHAFLYVPDSGLHGFLIVSVGNSS
jgi:hypothetical protein